VHIELLWVEEVDCETFYIVGSLVILKIGASSMVNFCMFLEAVEWWGETEF